MEAMRKIIHVNGTHLSLNIDVPQSFAGEDLEVLVFPVEKTTNKKNISHAPNWLSTIMNYRTKIDKPFVPLSRDEANSRLGA